MPMLRALGLLTQGIRVIGQSKRIKGCVEEQSQRRFTDLRSSGEIAVPRIVASLLCKFIIKRDFRSLRCFPSSAEAFRMNPIFLIEEARF